MGILLARDFRNEALGFSSAIYGCTIPMKLVEGNKVEKQKKDAKTILEQHRKSPVFNRIDFGRNQVIDQLPVLSKSLGDLIL